ncbi:MAG: ATP-binding protein [Phycisphaeraceae bacterium]
MLAFFRSLRFKLVAMFVGIFAAIQLLLGGAALIAREQYLYTQFDEQLTRRAQHVAVDLLQRDEPFSRTALARAVDRQRQTLQIQDIFVQLVDADGQVLERSGNLGDYRLPFDAAAAPTRQVGAETMTSLAGEPVEELIGRGETLRMVTLYVNTPYTRPFYLQAATSLAEVSEAIAFVRTLFFIAIPAGLVTASIASWFVAGNAIRQINDVADLAHGLRPETLDDRLAPAQSQDELGQMVGELNHALDRLEAGFQAQDRFLHDASHELKTPVSVLLSEAQVLRLSNPDKQACQRFAASVEEEMRRMGKLIESLLVLARADGRSAVATGQPVAVNDVVMAAIEQCTALARQRQVTLVPQLACPSAGDLLCQGDGDLLATMVSNLLRNAIRFSPIGGTVEVGVHRQDDAAIIDVRDRGPGVPTDEAERIFDRFAQGSNNPDRQGSGLGLTIARSIADLHQGQVHVCPGPAEGGGCVFRVRLPQSHPHHPPVESADGQAQPLRRPPP